MEIKRIGVLTSGGDAPGMNAAIRAVTRTAISRDIQVYGIKRGFNGLIHGELEELNLRSVSDIIQYGGTMLYTARCPEFQQEDGLRKAKKTCFDHDIQGIIVIGGDGSFKGAAEFSKRGVPCIGIPGTIDNDIGCTDYTIGYDTAMNTVTQMVDKLRDTTMAHDRCSVVEVMGRHAGYIALNAGIACGASYIIVPESYRHRVARHHSGACTARRQPYSAGSRRCQPDGPPRGRAPIGREQRPSCRNAGRWPG